MPVTVYKDVGYAGPSARFGPGFHSGSGYGGGDLRGMTRGSSYGDSLDNQITSIRVDTGYIAVLYSSYGETASGGSRTIIGPASIPDLAAVGIGDKTSAVRVVMFDPYRGNLPSGFGVTLHTSPNMGGAKIELGVGDYDNGRLKSDEIRLGAQNIQSLCAGPDTIAILYKGNNFEATLDSVLVAGYPAAGRGSICVKDTAGIGMSGGANGINSIRVLIGSARGERAGKPRNISTLGMDPWERARLSLGQSQTKQPRLLQRRRAERRAERRANPPTIKPAAGLQPEPTGRAASVQGPRITAFQAGVLILLLVLVLAIAAVFYATVSNQRLVQRARSD